MAMCPACSASKLVVDSQSLEDEVITPEMIMAQDSIITVKESVILYCENCDYEETRTQYAKYELNDKILDGLADDGLMLAYPDLD